MIDVIANLKTAADPLGHAGTGPQIGGKTAGPSAPQQVGFQLPAGRPIQLRRSARDRLRQQGAATV
jgi:hypothetical protein